MLGSFKGPLWGKPPLPQTQPQLFSLSSPYQDMTYRGWGQSF